MQKRHVASMFCSSLFFLLFYVCFFLLVFCSFLSSTVCRSAFWKFGPSLIGHPCSDQPEPLNAIVKKKCRNTQRCRICLWPLWNEVKLRKAQLLTPDLFWSLSNLLCSNSNRIGTYCWSTVSCGNWWDQKQYLLHTLSKYSLCFTGEEPVRKLSVCVFSGRLWWKFGSLQEWMANNTRTKHSGQKRPNHCEIRSFEHYLARPSPDPPLTIFCSSFSEK